MGRLGAAIENCQFYKVKMPENCRNNLTLHEVPFQICTVFIGKFSDKNL